VKRDSMSPPQSLQARDFSTILAARPEDESFKPYVAVLISARCLACLWEATEMLPAWTNFRVEPKMIRVSQEFLKQQLRLFQLPTRAKGIRCTKMSTQ